MLVGFTESFYQREKLRRIEGKSRKLRQGENDNVGCQLIQKRVKDELINMPRRTASESERGSASGRETEIGKASAQNFHKAGAKRCCKQLMRATGRKVETAKLKIKNKLETLSNAALTPSYPLSFPSPTPCAHHLPVMSVGAMTMTLIMTERMETTKAQTEQNENVDNGAGDEERQREREREKKEL